MARLTILQASQQGFGSTLTIHRHIKDGSLPTYEEGDTKLLDVDDLISLFGEPGVPVSDTGGTAAPGNIDVYEYNRMKSELDQKNKKNMWLAADLAEVVREMKEKESKFEAERDRLLKVLEQAQALLLREAERAGSALKNADGSVLTLDQIAPDNSSQPAPPPAPENKPQHTQVDYPAGDTSPDKGAFMPEPSLEDLLPPRSEESSSVPSPAPTSSGAENPLENSLPEALSETAETTTGTTVDLLGATVGGGDIHETKPDNAENEELEPINPLIPPLQAQRTAPQENRLLGTTTWLLMLTLVGGGFVFFEFRTQVMTSIAKIMKVLGGV